MRFSLAVAALFISGSIQAVTAARMGRFAIASSPTVGAREMTPQEIYARALTRRKPTPRCTPSLIGLFVNTSLLTWG